MNGASKWTTGAIVCLAMLGAAPALSGQAALCSKLTLTGQVQAGRAWRQPIGQGWVLRLVPIAGGYTGWDLAMDREQAAGYPDALLLATPPYGSISEREIGATFGLRAQDAIGWNPRSFHFLTDPSAFREAQGLFPLAASGAQTPAARQAAARLMELAATASAGQLRIDDAQLNPGVADPQPFAQAWAQQAARMVHKDLPPPDGKPTPRGALASMRFTVTLWLPEHWKTASGIRAVSGACER